MINHINIGIIFPDASNWELGQLSQYTASSMNWESKTGERDFMLAQTVQTGCGDPVAEY